MLPGLMPFVILVLIACSSATVADDLPQAKQTWSTRVGTYTIVASYVSQGDSDVTLSKDDGTEVTVPKSRLAEENVAWLIRKQFDDDDRQSEEQTQAMREGLTTHHEPASGALISIHNLYKSSPIAGLFAGLSLAAIENEPKKAITILTEAGRRIKAQREVDATAHHDTLVAILNNLAVCELMLGRPSPAANYLVLALREAGQMANGAIVHNAKLLLQASDKRGKEFVVAANTLGDLRLRTAQAKPSHDLNRYANLLVYTTQFSLPNPPSELVGMPTDEATVGVNSKGPATPAVVIPTTLDGLQLLGFGSGFAVAENWVMTNRHVAEQMASRQTLAIWNESIAARPNSKGPLVVSQVMIATSNDHDLALLQVDNLAATPLALCEMQPVEGTDLVIMGYPKPIDFGLSLMVGGGVLNKIHPSTRDLWTDAKIDGGNSGGPMLSLDGAVVGIAKASYLGGKTIESKLMDEKRGLGVFALEARSWVKRTAPQLTLAAAPDNAVLMNKSALVSMVRESVFSILVFGDKPIADAHIPTQVNPGGSGVASGGQSVGYFIPNVWCLACSGRGMVPCTNTKCQGGGIPVKERVVVGQNHLGNPLFADRINRVSCSTCNGAGGRHCTNCNRGKVASW